MTLLLVIGLALLGLACFLIYVLEEDLGWAVWGMALACMIVNLIIEVGGVLWKAT